MNEERIKANAQILEDVMSEACDITKVLDPAARKCAATVPSGMRYHKNLKSLCH